MQSVLTQETLATLSNTITAAVASTLQNVAQVPPSASAAIPVVQFIPDPPQRSGTAVHGSSDIAETTPPTGNADQLVQHTVDIPCAVTSPPSKNTFLSAAVSLTQQVPDKVKKLIWANEYVDFAIHHYTFRVEKDDGA